MAYRSDILRMSPRKMVSTMIYLYGTVPVATVAALAVPALALGIFLDIRWLVVFLMIIFLLVPMAMSFLYFYHGLRPSTASNTSLHRLHFDNDGIKVSIVDIEHSEKGDDEHVIVTRSYPFSSVRSVMTSGDGVIILLATPYKGFLWLPYDAFPIREDIRKVLDLIHHGQTIHISK